LRAPESVHDLSPNHREWLRSALGGDPRTSLDDLLSDIYAELAQLWQVAASGSVRALVVTRLVFYPRCSSMEVWLCGGHEMKRWIHLLGELEQHARNLGCRFIELRGRRGWERALTDYALRAVLLEKEL
jgi:hypothetical protein